MPLYSDIQSLILKQGDIAAQRAIAQGNAAGGTLANIGQTIGSIPAQIQQRQAQAQQNELNTLRVHNERGELADKDKARAKQAAIEQHLSQYDDIEEAIPGLYKIDPTFAASIAKEVRGAQSEALKFQEQVLSTERTKADFISSKLSTEDPGQYTKNLYTLKKAFPDRDWSGFTGDPSQDKPAIQGLMQEAQTTQQRIAAQQKAIDDERMANATKETARHNAALESLNTTNTLSDNARADAVAKETARHNTQMEKAALIRATRPPSSSGGGANTSDVKESVTGMREGTIPPQMPGRASKDYTATMAEAHRQGYDLASAVTDWSATQKHVATLNGAQQTRMAQAIDNAAHSLDVIDNLADEWNGGRFPALNKVTLSAAKNGAMGAKAQQIATKLDAQIADVTSELANVYMGGNSPTDHALSLAAKNLQADWTRDQLKSATALSRKNLQIRSNSMRNVGVAGASPNNPYAAPAQPAAPKLRFNPATGKTEPYQP